MIQTNEVIRIGKVRKSNDAKGQLLCTLENELFQDAEPEFLVVQCDNILVPFYIEEYRYRGEDGLLVRLEGIQNERQSQLLCGNELYLLRSSLPQDSIDGLEQVDWNGFLVIDENKGELGRIVDTDDSTINVLWALEDGMLVPAHEDFIRDVDTERQILYVSLPEGLC